MKIRTLALFLIGDREAIVTIARTPHAVWIALLFVLTGGLARNYDKESFLFEPVHFVGPLIVSTLIGTGLFLLLRTVVNPTLRQPEPPVPLERQYLTFMTLYWMTAPMAWLYGIPTEQLTDIVTATGINLWTLALVSLWRVLLMARIASVLFGMSAIVTGIYVLAFSNVVAAVVLIATPFPIINVMGGVDLSQSERLISGIATSTVLLSMVTVPLLLVISFAALFCFRGSWQIAPTTPETREGVSRSTTVLAFASLAFWLSMLPLTQPAQSLRFRTEKALLSNDIEAGVDMMSTAGREAYPPAWDPPPRRLYGESSPDVLVVLQHLLDRDEPDPWVLERYVAKLDRQLDSWRSWREADALPRLADILGRLDEGPRLAWEHRDRLESMASDTEEDWGALQQIEAVASEYADG